MTSEEVTSLFRKGEGRLFLENVAIRDKKGNVHEGSGTLTVGSPKLHIDVSISKFGRFNLAEILGIVHRKDFWDVRGTAEHELRFRCPKVPPVNSARGNFRGTLWSFEADCFEIIHDLVHDPFRGAWMRIRGVLPNYQLTFADELTTTTTENAFWGKLTSSKVDFFRSETKYFKFGFQQCDADVHVFFEPRSGWRSCSPFNVMRQWQSLLKALAFVTGIEARPFLEVFSPGDKWVERFRPIRPPAATSCTPFSQKLSFAEKHPTTALALMAEFLCDSPIGDDIAATMYLLRAVGGKSLRLTTLVHAVLFEGLVDVLYKHINPPARTEQEQQSDEAFEKAKEAVQNEIDAKVKAALEPEAAAYRRLLGLVSSTRVLRTREKFERLAVHYKLPDLEDCLDAWSKARNPLAHGKLVSTLSPETLEQDWRHAGLIASAINILVLKSIGYSGSCKKWSPLPETIDI